MWAKGIIASFVVFASFIVVLVVICMKQDITLETKDYYKDELAYQQKIDARNNTRTLNQKPQIKYLNSDKVILVDFVEKTIHNGRINLYKPDQAKSDFNLNVTNDATVDMSQRSKGLWKIKINWLQNGKNFYYEEPIIIN